MTPNERKLIEDFVNDIILQGVDRGLRRAVRSCFEDLKKAEEANALLISFIDGHCTCYPNSVRCEGCQTIDEALIRGGKGEGER